MQSKLKMIICILVILCYTKGWNVFSFTLLILYSEQVALLSELWGYFHKELKQSWESLFIFSMNCWLLVDSSVVDPWENYLEVILSYDSFKVDLHESSEY